MRSFTKNILVKNVSIIFSGHFINQVILLITYPVFSRLYEPEQLGMFEQVNAIFLVLFLVSTGRYDMAFLVQKSKAESRRLLYVALVYLGMVTLISSILAIFLSIPKVGSRVGWQWNPYIGWLPVLVITAGLQQILFNWEIRNSRYKAGNISTILKSSTNSIMKVFPGYLFLTVNYLFFSRILSYLLSILYLLRANSIQWAKLFKQDTIKLWKTAVRYKEYPLYLSLSSLVNRVATSMVAIMIVNYWDLRLLGIYTMATMVINVPANIVRQSVQTVFLKEMSDRAKKNIPLVPKLKLAMLILFSMGLIPAILISVWSPTIFSFVVGERWLESGHIASLLVWWFYATIVATPAMAIVPLIKVQKGYLIYQLFLLSTRLVLLIATFSLSADAYDFFRMLVIHGTLLNLVFILGIMIAAGKYDRTRGYV